MMADRDFDGPFMITGMSGAGKTVLSRSLEDLGYLCVDNIPLELVPELFETSANDIPRLVVVLDVRTRGFTDTLPEVYRQLKERESRLRLVFVEASPEVLQRRFSVARRPHPLRERSLEQAIADEGRELEGVRQLSDLIVDTTHLTVHDLRRQVLSLAGVDTPDANMTVEVQSFSYLQGVPPTASLVFDVRFLPNPYFVDTLRSLPGDDPQVSAWLEQHEEVRSTVSQLRELVEDLLPRYARELKTDLLIAVGCTGGRHRSVYVAERLGRQLADAGHAVTIHHRDRDRWRFA
jgi:UPF0042 nucleotide-binding protein